MPSGILRSLVCGLVVVASSDAVRAQAPPHLVLILADDMGWGDPACQGADSRIPTPHIDRLAAAGMRFTDAHAAGSVCVPSRYGLLTGRYPARRRTFRPGREAVVRAGTPTVADVLQAGGYHTAMVGKWHLGFDGADQLDHTEPLRGGPLDRGFDSWFGIPASLDIPPYYYVRDRGTVRAPTERIDASATEGWSPIQGAFWREGGIAPGFQHHEVLPRFRDEAVAVIRDHALAHAAEPLFLYLALPAPHTPWLPEARFRGASGAGLYGDFATQVDAAVGEVLDALDAAGLGEDTLVLFTSDNGPVWYPDDVERFGHSSTGPFRGMKGDSWEGGHRVPFVVRWPGRVTAGGSSEQLVGFTDVFATFAEVAGVSVPRDAAEDSISFASTLRGVRDGVRREHLVLKADASVVREGSTKLIRHRGSGGFSRPRSGPDSDPPGQLYDLDREPGETTNRYEQRSEVVARLERVARRVEQPNVVVILADDMGYGDSSVYGGWLETPGLERMAREGMVFTDFHTSGVVCSPTRAGLLTGRYQQRAGLAEVVNADPAVDAHHRGLQPIEVTFAELLGAAGYRTAVFGKWHLGYAPAFNPTRHGFDEFVGFVSGNVDYRSRYDRMGVFDWWVGEEKTADAGYLTDRITDHAVGFLAANAHRPFCLYVAHGAVHTPIQDLDSPAQRGPERAGARDARPRDEIVRGMMQRLDHSVTRILDAVRAEGLAGRTLVLFLSDNGGAVHMRNDPLRGRKGQVWEGGHRVPAIAWWPGTIAKGTRSDALCSSLDVMPTMLGLAGLEPPADRPLDGRSLEPVLRGGEGEPGRRLFWKGTAMREERWKLVEQRGTAQLFDLAEDLGETRDLAAEHPERVAAMRAELEAWRRDVAAGATRQPR